MCIVGDCSSRVGVFLMRSFLREKPRKAKWKIRWETGCRARAARSHPLCLHLHPPNCVCAPGGSKVLRAAQPPVVPVTAAVGQGPGESWSCCALQLGPAAAPGAALSGGGQAPASLPRRAPSTRLSIQHYENKRVTVPAMPAGQMPALQVAALLLTSGKCLYTAESGKTLHGNDLLELLACEERLASCSHLFRWPTLTGRPGTSPTAEPAAPVASPGGHDAVWRPPASVINPVPACS